MSEPVTDVLTRVRDLNQHIGPADRHVELLARPAELSGVATEGRPHVVLDAHN